MCMSVEWGGTKQDRVIAYTYMEGFCGLPGELVHDSYVQFSRARPPEGVHELAKWHGRPKMADTGKRKAALRKHHTALVFVSVSSRLPALRPTHVHVHGTVIKNGRLAKTW